MPAEPLPAVGCRLRLLGDAEGHQHVHGVCMLAACMQGRSRTCALHASALDSAVAGTSVTAFTATLDATSSWQANWKVRQRASFNNKVTDAQAACNNGCVHVFSLEVKLVPLLLTTCGGIAPQIWSLPGPSTNFSLEGSTLQDT